MPRPRFRPYWSIVILLLIRLGTPSAGSDEPPNALANDLGKVITVNGPIDPTELGETLMHEHLFIDFWLPADQPQRWSQLFGRRPPESAEDLAIWHEPLTMNNRISMVSEMWANKDAFALDCYEDALTEVTGFTSLGGRTIVDVTTVGLNRQPELLRRVAEESNANVIMGTGFYRTAWHPASIADLTVKQLALLMHKDITVGIDGTGVRAGIIGEIPIEKISREGPPSAEMRVLQAAALASTWTGAAITLHSDFYDMTNAPRRRYSRAGWSQSIPDHTGAYLIHSGQ